MGVVIGSLQSCHTRCHSRREVASQSSKTLRLLEEFVWLGGRESLPSRSETSINTRLFRLTHTVPVIWRFPILSSAFVRSRPFSGFASAMTLEMTLAATISGVLLSKASRRILIAIHVRFTTAEPSSRTREARMLDGFCLRRGAHRPGNSPSICGPTVNDSVRHERGLRSLGRSPDALPGPETYWAESPTFFTRLRNRASDRISSHRGSRLSQTSQCDRSR